MYPESVVYTGVMLECATPGVLGHSIQVLVLSEENLKMLLHLLLSGWYIYIYIYPWFWCEALTLTGDPRYSGVGSRKTMSLRPAWRTQQHPGSSQGQLPNLCRALGPLMAWRKQKSLVLRKCSRSLPVPTSSPVMVMVFQVTFQRLEGHAGSCTHKLRAAVTAHKGSSPAQARQSPSMERGKVGMKSQP